MRLVKTATFATSENVRSLLVLKVSYRVGGAWFPWAHGLRDASIISCGRLPVATPVTLPMETFFVFRGISRHLDHSDGPRQSDVALRN